MLVPGEESVGFMGWYITNGQNKSSHGPGSTPGTPPRNQALHSGPGRGGVVFGPSLDQE